MKDYMMALHQRFCKEPDCRKIRKQIREVEQELHQKLDRRGQEQLLKLADLENELQEEISLESFLSGFKLALGIAAEPAAGRVLIRRIHSGGVATGLVRTLRQAQHPAIHSGVLPPGNGGIHDPPDWER